MRLPSKITSYGESVISKFPPVLSVLQDADTGVLALYDATTKHFSSIEDFMDIVYTQALILCHKCFINDYSDISANTFAIHTLHTALNSPYNTYSFAKTDSFNYQSVVEKIVYATIANKGLVHPEAYGWLQDLFRLISETE